ncbi:MAG: cystathionine gamma-synthase family protein [Candidatus Marinimicrobia bacterium]|mgnify:CR=1 FL=1|jgi:methionine-gamma-lyase|nr:cystathionine gamma-synthase family protein [Candidatus Neomarinimicrobiota bacterium]MBT3763550.1 cystathionine gamma-synthase family protein [Candidatus Neomarinimicrobiota bacterium]MBT4067561.1 cystathionine gamma-synthase family protein [Candidatus Neomarinimicrobiota bacterium]MBT4270374.1 cystathionine gamma-synthase family protein [Candidatus Neomarinimicrobiota bacterium]MBT4372741.1 cystathionine gamma-synthase family protein [Candidatus Neomarinimicrobiota bacterium]
MFNKNLPKSIKPESLMMSYGYQSEWSEGAVKCPIFQTSTFAFRSAEEGKAFFEVAYGLREKNPDENMGLIYSRLNNPDLEILENRLCLWDKAEACAVFESGMSAISTVLLEYLKPGDLLIYSKPIYGGSDHFINHFLTKYGITVLGIHADNTKDEIVQKINTSGLSDRLGVIYMETPANPTNALMDIAMCREVADQFSTHDHPVQIAVDNTYMGPLWSQPLAHGANMVIYSATKYIGGHSDLIAGAVLGSNEVIQRIKGLRTFLGNMTGPWTGWLLMRSLETLKARMEIQLKNATIVAEYLDNHDQVEKVYYLGFIPEGTRQFEIYKKQYSSPGAMLSFDVIGGEAEAFNVLNNLKLIQLAVSLGGTESLAEHPYTMTHADVSVDQKQAMGITEKMIRLSVGVENSDDIIWDLEQALSQA